MLVTAESGTLFFDAAAGFLPPLQDLPARRLTPDSGLRVLGILLDVGFIELPSELPIDGLAECLSVLFVIETGVLKRMKYSESHE